MADPQGRFTTWSGVGFSVWHHGRSGIGATELPAVQSNVAVFALGNVSANGREIAAGVPIHVMTSARDGARLELHVGDANFPLPEVPGGHLRVVWTGYDGGHAPHLSYARYAWGGGVLLVLLGFAMRPHDPVPSMGERASAVPGPARQLSRVAGQGGGDWRRWPPTSATP